PRDQESVTRSRTGLYELLVALKGVVRIVQSIAGGCMPGFSQQVFYLFDSQDRNKVFDLGLLLKLLCCSTQHPFNFGYRARELFTQALHDTLPLHTLTLERHPYVLNI